ncbi:cell division protein FtsQ/DivIB [Isobaculum melis]|uniref:Cell division protein DivIB n=1 Tax=Isobaculum melis TaxID=142588 RepID=A0A1H9T808_9LACT|nr:FtsQ-type POTRA domain-containing protein [Isobaculum melis]SER92889.1 cell division protein FtsQ [Isobaculum melis]
MTQKKRFKQKRQVAAKVPPEQRNTVKGNKKRVVSMEAKLPKLKQLRKRKMRKRLWLLLSLFSFAILLIIYFQSSLSHVNLIEIEGADEVTEQSVIDASQIRSGDDLWHPLFSKKELEKSIQKKLPQVKSVKINLNGINSLTLTITEYKTMAYLSKEDQYYNILENGKILKESRKVTLGNKLIVRNFEEGDVLDQFIQDLDHLTPKIQNTISEVSYEPTDTNKYLINLYMNDGNMAIASIPDFYERLKYYAGFTEEIRKEYGEQKGIVDLEVGAFFYPYGHENMAPPKEETPPTE